MARARGQRTPKPPPNREELEQLDALTDRLPAELRAFRDRGVLSAVRRFRIEQALAQRSRSVLALLDGVHDPHNQAAVIRTSEALGLQEVHTVASAEEPFRPSPRVTQNAHVWLDLVRHASFEDAADALHERGFELWGAAMTEVSISVRELPFDRPLALVFGNESLGLAGPTLSRCDGAFTIPLRGFSQSLNVSVAAAVALWSAVATRESRFGTVGDLEEDDRMRLRRRFYRRAAGLDQDAAGVTRVDKRDDE